MRSVCGRKIHVAGRVAVEGRRCLGSRVGDVVAGALAAALERVQQVEPVAHLVGRRVAQAVVAPVAAGQRAEVDHDAVESDLRATAAQNFKLK